MMRPVNPTQYPEMPDEKQPSNVRVKIVIFGFILLTIIILGIILCIFYQQNQEEFDGAGIDFGKSYQSIKNYMEKQGFDEVSEGERVESVVGCVDYLGRTWFSNFIFSNDKLWRKSVATFTTNEEECLNICNSVIDECSNKDYTYDVSLDEMCLNINSTNIDDVKAGMVDNLNNSDNQNSVKAAFTTSGGKAVTLVVYKINSSEDISNNTAIKEIINTFNTKESMKELISNTSGDSVSDYYIIGVTDLDIKYRTKY